MKSAGYLVLAIAVGNAVAQTSAQNGTINLEDIVISTDLVAPVVSTEDSITESAQEVNETATAAMEQESPKAEKARSGDIFAEVPAADAEPEILVIGTTNEVPDTSAVERSQDSGGGSIFSDIELTGTDSGSSMSIANIQPREDSTGEQSTDKSEDTDAATTQPESPVEITGDKVASGQVIEPDSVPTESPLAEPLTPASASGDPQPVSQAPDEQQQESIDEDAIIAGWANAWSKNDVEAYLDYYADDFVPTEPGMDRQGWEKVRRQRLENEDIRIIVSNAELYEVTPQRAEVRFTQRYTSKNYRDRVIKAIEMKHTASGWKFISERTIEELPFK